MIAARMCCTSLDRETEQACVLIAHRHYSLAAAVAAGPQLLEQLPPEKSLQLMMGVAELLQFVGEVGQGAGLQESLEEGVAHWACAAEALAPVVDASMQWSCSGDCQTHPSCWSSLEVLWEAVTPSCGPWSQGEVASTCPDWPASLLPCWQTVGAFVAGTA